MVKHLCFQGTEEPFLGRSNARLSSRALMFTYSVQGEQLFKVHAGKLRPSIDGDRRRQPSVALDTQPKNSQARTITWWIKGQMVSGNAPGMRENEQSEPTFPQRLTS